MMNHYRLTRESAARPNVFRPSIVIDLRPKRRTPAGSRRAFEDRRVLET
jgi:hypothetical protein